MLRRVQDELPLEERSELEKGSWRLSDRISELLPPSIGKQLQERNQVPNERMLWLKCPKHIISSDNNHMQLIFCFATVYTGRIYRHAILESRGYGWNMIQWIDARGGGGKWGGGNGEGKVGRGYSTYNGDTPPRARYIFRVDQTAIFCLPFVITKCIRIEKGMHCL